MDIDLFEYQPLLNFVNESLTRDNWENRLTDVEAWQLEWTLGLEAVKGATAPKIDGRTPNLERSRALQASLRKQLTSLAELCRDRKQLSLESVNASAGVRGKNKAWSWRKAQVLPTRQLFFEDAGQALGFLVEDLEYQLKIRAEKIISSEKFSRHLKMLLHVAQCECGCKSFFLWEGNGTRKRRKYLDDKHRMDFHNARNVELKKRLARRRRSQGDPSYF